jgi:hypothetical protein
LGIAFHAVGQFARLLFELHADLFADGLNLALIGSGADHEKVSERGDAGEIQYFNVGCLLRFSGADGDEPGGRGCGFLRNFVGFCRSQNTLLFVSYYKDARAGVMADVYFS